MKNIDEIRRDRLEDLVNETKTKSLEEVAEIAGTSSAYLSQIRNKLPDSKTGKPKKMGDMVAEKLRISFNKPAGWMDTDHHAKLKMDYNVVDAETKIKRCPLISWVKAGELCDVGDVNNLTNAEDWLICGTQHSDKTFALLVVGDSMSPEYQDGWYIFVDPDVQARHNDDVIVRDEYGKATFKRLQITHDGSFLLALNPDYPNRILKVPETSTICGVVIYSGKKRK